MTYISYIRVSTKRQGDSGLGLEAQRFIIKNYYPDVVQEFLEVESGKNITDRPILQAALDYCVKNKTTLIAAKVDRLSRCVDDCLYIYKILNKRIKFCDIPGDVDKFTLTMYAAFAEREREITSLRTKAALAHVEWQSTPKREQVLTNKTFKQAGANRMRQNALNSEENQRSVAMAVQLKQSGKTLKQICSELNANKFLTAVKTQWSPSSLHKAMKRAVT